MSKKTVRTVVMIIALVVMYFGFKLVTQSGLQGTAGSVQNDGYAVSGGLLTLFSGLIFGWLTRENFIKK